MIGLIKKDWLLIIKSISSVYAIAIGAPLLAVVNNSDFFLPLLSLVISMLFAMQITTTMSLDENVKWRKNVTAMPISAFQEALSKYILTILLAILSSLIVMLLGFIGRNIFSIDNATVIIYTSICFPIVSIYNSIIIPAAYRYGVAKSRYILMLFLLIPALLPYLLKFLNIQVNMQALTNTGIYRFIISGFVVSLIFLLISLFISTRILKNYKSILEVK